MVRASSEKLGNGGDKKVAHGEYHFLVNESKPWVYDNNEIGFELVVEVQDGTVPDQGGKQMQFQTFHVEWDSFFDLCAALNLTDQATGTTITPELLQHLREEKKAGKKVEFSWDFDPAECVARQFFGDVVADKKRDGTVKDFPRIGRKIYSIADKRTAKIPANEEMITAALGMTRAEFFGGAQAAPAPAPVGADAEVDAMFK